MNIFLFLIFLVINPFPDSEWQIKKDKDGIEVYTRSIEGSSFDEFKGITTIAKSSLSEVLEVILDVKNYESLFPDCMNPKVLKQDGKYYDIHYIQVKAPWPVKNRDTVYEQKTVVDKNGKHAIISLKPLPDLIVEDKDFIRIREGSGFWELEEDDSNNVKVTYQFHGEPGGDIPAWLANSFVVTQPFQTLQNLKSRSKSK
jgi:ribosome-associated toxin RatA of RatAB toxin-antitoxin module